MNITFWVERENIFGHNIICFTVCPPSQKMLKFRLWGWVMHADYYTLLGFQSVSINRDEEEKGEENGGSRNIWLPFITDGDT